MLRKNVERDIFWLLFSSVSFAKMDVTYLENSSSN